MSSTCGITSPYSNVISARFINNNALVYNMQRLSSVYTIMPDRHLLSLRLTYHLNVGIDWIQMLPMELILAEIYKEKRTEHSFMQYNCIRSSYCK